MLVQMYKRGGLQCRSQSVQASCCRLCQARVPVLKTSVWDAGHFT